MKGIGSIIILVSFLFFPFILQGQINELYNVKFDKVVIRCQSNIEKFDFYYENNNNDPVIQISPADTITSYTFNIPVKNIKSDRSYLLSEFRDLVRSKEFPFIILEIDSINPAKMKDDYTKTIATGITITDIKKQYNICLTRKAFTDSSCIINGNIGLSLCDYKLGPLTRFFGLIKINNKVTIDFRLILFMKSDRE